MKLPVSLIFGLVSLVPASFGGTPIVSITSAQPFMLDGTSVSSPGVTSWPIILSDKVTTQDGGALLKFKDGSSVSLAPKTQVSLIGTDEAPQLILVAGTLDYKLAVGSRLSIVTADKTDQDADKQPQTAGAPTAGHAKSGASPIKLPGAGAMYYGAAGGSLAGLGVAVDRLLQPNNSSPR